MTFHDRDWIALTLNWLVITGGAFLSIVAVYLPISPDDMQQALQRTARWHCSIQASIMIDRSFYMLILVMGLFYVAAGRSMARKPKRIRIEVLESWRTTDRGQCSCSFEC
jgi:hypothetical protein